MTITTSSASDVLATAYPIAIYYDNDPGIYVAELTAFNCQIHASSWDAAATAARATNQLLIEAYRLYGYQLPEVL